ncbi:MAG: tryptophan-rich sensory protein [Olsenella sp.]|nr:tryptophan-rich sensory protein [Olsenella sp.]
MERVRTTRRGALVAAAAVALPLAIGAVSALLSADVMGRFGSMNQPPLSPPAWLFPVAWTILYVLMGLASYLLYVARPMTEEVRKLRTRALVLYAAQLVLNFVWTPIFFNGGLYYVAFVILVGMWVLIAALMATAVKVDRRATFLLIPYLVWTTFAGYLNIMIALLN